MALQQMWSGEHFWTKMSECTALTGKRTQTLPALKSSQVKSSQFERCLMLSIRDPHDTKITHICHWIFLPMAHFFSTTDVILHLCLFAWRNAKHNEFQVQTQTPLPIPVRLTRWDTQTTWRHPHRQASTLVAWRETLQRTITNPGDSHMARGSIETMCLLCDDPSLSVPSSLSLTSLLSPHSDSLPFFSNSPSFSWCIHHFILSHHHPNTNSLVSEVVLIDSHFFLPALALFPLSSDLFFSDPQWGDSNHP